MVVCVIVVPGQRVLEELLVVRDGASSVRYRVWHARTIDAMEKNLAVVLCGCERRARADEGPPSERLYSSRSSHPDDIAARCWRQLLTELGRWPRNRAL